MLGVGATGAFMTWKEKNPGDMFSSAYGDSDARPMSSPTATPLGQNSCMTTTEDRAAVETTVTMKTSMGDITIGLFDKDAPKTVENFLKLSNNKFYNGTRFHRVIKDFMIQGGDPNSKDADRSNDGTGGPGYKFDDEVNSHKLVCGTLAMANSGPNTNGSQFFIVTAPSTPWLDGKHTAFGKVLEGLDVVRKIEAAKTDGTDHPVEDITVTSIIVK